jgi:hypothetical protein
LVHRLARGSAPTGRYARRRWRFLDEHRCVRTMTLQRNDASQTPRFTVLIVAGNMNHSHVMAPKCFILPVQYISGRAPPSGRDAGMPATLNDCLPRRRQIRILTHESASSGRRGHISMAVISTSAGRNGLTPPRRSNADDEGCRYAADALASTSASSYSQNSWFDIAGSFMPRGTENPLGETSIRSQLSQLNSATIRASNAGSGYRVPANQTFG